MKRRHTQRKEIITALLDSRFCDQHVLLDELRYHVLIQEQAQRQRSNASPYKLGSIARTIRSHLEAVSITTSGAITHMPWHAIVRAAVFRFGDEEYVAEVMRGSTIHANVAVIATKTFASQASRGEANEEWRRITASQAVDRNERQAKWTDRYIATRKCISVWLSGNSASECLFPLSQSLRVIVPAGSTFSLSMFPETAVSLHSIRGGSRIQINPHSTPLPLDPRG